MAETSTRAQLFRNLVSCFNSTS